MHFCTKIYGEHKVLTLLSSFTETVWADKIEKMEEFTRDRRTRVSESVSVSEVVSEVRGFLVSEPVSESPLSESVSADLWIIDVDFEKIKFAENLDFIKNVDQKWWLTFFENPTFADSFKNLVWKWILLDLVSARSAWSRKKQSRATV